MSPVEETRRAASAPRLVKVLACWGVLYWGVMAIDLARVAVLGVERTVTALPGGITLHVLGALCTVTALALIAALFTRDARVMQVALGAAAATAGGMAASSVPILLVGEPLVGLRFVSGHAATAGIFATMAVHVHAQRCDAGDLADDLSTLEEAGYDVPRAGRE